MFIPENTTKPGTTSAGTIAQKSQLAFLAAFIREPLTVGSFWPSSASLARVVVDSCEFASEDTVVELGPGTGVFTEQLLERLGPHGRLLAVDINLANIDELQRRCPRCRVIHDSAEHLGRHVDAGKASCIISGLAWGNMLPVLQDRIFEAILSSLAPSGQFVAFGYIHAAWFPTALRFRRRLFRTFEQVETTPIVWRNMPPAFVYCCRGHRSDFGREKTRKGSDHGPRDAVVT